jgi:hypothetical protein
MDWVSLSDRAGRMVKQELLILHSRPLSRFRVRLPDVVPSAKWDLNAMLAL